MPEPAAQQGAETTVVEPAAAAGPKAPEGGEVDFEALYKKEVTNSISLRERAQKAEATNDTVAKDAEAVRLARMKEEGKIAELNTEHETTIETLTAENAAFTEKFKVIAEAEAKERETLLGTLPEEKRDLYKTVTDLPSLRTLIAEVTGASPPGTFEGHPGGGGEAIKFRTDMTPEEQKDWLAQKTAASLGK